MKETLTELEYWQLKAITEGLRASDLEQEAMRLRSELLNLKRPALLSLKQQVSGAIAKRVGLEGEWSIHLADNPSDSVFEWEEAPKEADGQDVAQKLKGLRNGGRYATIC